MPDLLAHLRKNAVADPESVLMCQLESIAALNGQKAKAGAKSAVKRPQICGLESLVAEKPALLRAQEAAEPRALSKVSKTGF